MSVKKEEEQKKDSVNLESEFQGKSSSNGLIIFLIIVIVLLGIFIIKNSSNNQVSADNIDIIKSPDKSTTIFIVKDLYLNVNNDFETGFNPVYDVEYCKKKFLQVSGNKAISCTVNSIKTLSRLNPLPKEIECSCQS